jgi:hypothetical protein
MPIAVLADKGQERAINRLKVIHKFAYPDDYEVPTAVISELAEKYHTSPHLARAWAIRQLMYDLSWVVTPVRHDKSLLEGAVKLRDDEEFPISKERKEWHQRAAKHIKRNTTLQSLAMSIYLEDLEKEGIILDTRHLKLDMQKLREWEEINLKDVPPSRRLPLCNVGGYPSAHIHLIPMYSEGWKLKYRRGDKK